MSYQSNDGADMQKGAVFGAGAYVVGLILTVIAVETEVIDELIVYQLFDFEGYLFAQLQFHELNLLSDGQFISEFLPLTGVMGILLIATGFIVASMASGRRSSGGPADGASIAVGYFAMTVLAIIVFIGLSNADFDIGEIIPLLLMTGVIFPLVFGSLGGLLAQSQ